jgi:SAM-dependent methyltransferase
MTNTDQITAWGGSVGKTWVRFNAQLDRQLEPIGAEVARRLAPLDGCAILDVGCGAGATSRELAGLAGPGGKVLGVDISTPMLELARQKSDAANLTYVEADAQTHAFEPDSIDVLHSRFGVMFFDDPPAAFANLRRAARPGARLAFACWRSPAQNEWLQLPMRAAAGLFPERPTFDPVAPGPFAFADDARVRQILEQSGWTGVGTEPLDLQIGGSNLEDTVQMMIRVGPLGAAIREAGPTPEMMAQADALVRPAVEPYATADGVLFPSATWIVTARNG